MDAKQIYFKSSSPDQARQANLATNSSFAHLAAQIQAANTRQIEKIVPQTFESNDYTNFQGTFSSQPKPTGRIGSAHPGKQNSRLGNHQAVPLGKTRPKSSVQLIRIQDLAGSINSLSAINRKADVSKMDPEIYEIKQRQMEAERKRLNSKRQRTKSAVPQSLADKIQSSKFQHKTLQSSQYLGASNYQSVRTQPDDETAMDAVEARYSQDFVRNERLDHLVKNINNVKQILVEEQAKEDFIIGEKNLTEEKTTTNFEVIETWLSQTLSQAENQMDKVPTKILKGSLTDQLVKYGISRSQLLECKISVADTERIYRCLFVYSLGFYEMLFKLFQHSPRKNTILLSIWKVFAILLEFCCKSNYDMVIKTLEEEQNFRVQDLESKLAKAIQDSLDIEKELKDELYQARKDYSLLQIDHDNTKSSLARIQEEVEGSKKQNEEQTQLRIKFETKINSLHALYRNMTAKHVRAYEEIKELEKVAAGKDEQIKSMKAELLTLRSKKVEHESQIQVQKEQLKRQETEMDYQNSLAKEQASKIEDLNREIDGLYTKLKDKHVRIQELEINEESLQKFIGSQKAQISHLELSLEETRKINTEYFEKTEVAKKRAQEVTDKINSIVIEQTSIQTIKKDRDERIAELRGQVDDIETKLLKTQKSESSLKIELERLQLAHSDVVQAHEVATDNLSKVNKCLQTCQLELETTQKNLAEKESKLSELNKDYEFIRGINTKQEAKLVMAERDFDALRIQLDSIKQQSKIQRLQLLQKTEMMNQFIAVEKDAKEAIIKKFEEAKQKNIKLTSEIVELTSQIEDNNQVYSKQRQAVRLKNEQLMKLQKEKDTLQKTQSKLDKKQEYLAVELKYKQEFISNIEAHEIHVKRIQDEKHRKEMAALQGTINLERMRQDDIWGHAARLRDRVVKLEEELEKAEDDLFKTKKDRDRLEGIRKGLLDNVRNLKDRVSDLSTKLDAEKRLKHELEHNLREAQRDNTLHLSKISSLEKELEVIPLLQRKIDDLETFKQQQLKVIYKKNRDSGMQTELETMEAASQTEPPVEEIKDDILSKLKKGIKEQVYKNTIIAGQQQIDSLIKENEDIRKEQSEKLLNQRQQFHQLVNGLRQLNKQKEFDKEILKPKGLSHLSFDNHKPDRQKLVDNDKPKQYSPAEKDYSPTQKILESPSKQISFLQLAHPSAPSHQKSTKRANSSDKQSLDEQGVVHIEPRVSGSHRRVLKRSSMDEVQLKRVFRIRSTAEQEELRAYQEKNQTLKQDIQNLKKSHSILVQRPLSSLQQSLIRKQNARQNQRKNRQNLHSAAIYSNVPPTKEMAFGGVLLPTQIDQDSNTEMIFESLRSQGPESSQKSGAKKRMAKIAKCNFTQQNNKGKSMKNSQSQDTDYQHVISNSVSGYTLNPKTRYLYGHNKSQEDIEKNLQKPTLASMERTEDDYENLSFLVHDERLRSAKFDKESQIMAKKLKKFESLNHDLKNEPASFHHRLTAAASPNRNDSNEISRQQLQPVKSHQNFVGRPSTSLQYKSSNNTLKQKERRQRSLYQEISYPDLPEDPLRSSKRADTLQSQRPERKVYSAQQSIHASRRQPVHLKGRVRMKVVMNEDPYVEQRPAEADHKPQNIKNLLRMVNSIERDSEDITEENSMVRVLGEKTKEMEAYLQGNL